MHDPRGGLPKGRKQREQSQVGSPRQKPPRCRPQAAARLAGRGARRRYLESHRPPSPLPASGLSLEISRCDASACARNYRPGAKSTPQEGWYSCMCERKSCAVAGRQLTVALSSVAFSQRNLTYATTSTLDTSGVALSFCRRRELPPEAPQGSLATVRDREGSLFVRSS